MFDLSSNPYNMLKLMAQSQCAFRIISQQSSEIIAFRGIFHDHGLSAISGANQNKKHIKALVYLRKEKY